MANTAEMRTADLAEIRGRIRAGATQGHYYLALLGLRVYEPLRVYQAVRKGFSYAAFERLQRNTGLPARALADFAQIPSRTLARRRGEGRLEPEESDRLVRIARVFGHALGLFEGDVEAARQWLTAEQPALGNIVPLELARTEVGAAEVEQLIGRLEHGIPA
ncbi:MAG TPA: antitoxin Xre/MbcA/ParS toxin-binding domain-containing protein [Gemmatimonadaceae bacterium]|nr:antitoxin Xre/MbcA/ParS toxin-binding domain-containing protein [Gemmatimonadaceae bacterium]